MTTEEKAALIAEAEQEIERAERHGLELTLKDFQVIDGGLTVDGMEPREWIEAVSGLHEEEASMVIPGMWVAVPGERHEPCFEVAHAYSVGMTRVLELRGHASVRVESGAKVIVENE